MVFVEYSHIHFSGKGEPNQLGIDSIRSLPGLRKLATMIKKNDALAGIQITHGGGKRDVNLSGGKLMATSQISVPTIRGPLEIPQAMSIAEIKLYQRQFIAAAKLAYSAGFDIVEIHCAGIEGGRNGAAARCRVTRKGIVRYGRG